MCSFRLYGIIPSHAHDPEKYFRERGRTARLNRGMTLGGITSPQQEYYAKLHTTFSALGYHRSRSSWAAPSGGSLRSRSSADCTLCATGLIAPGEGQSDPLGMLSFGQSSSAHSEGPCHGWHCPHTGRGHQERQAIGWPRVPGQVLRRPCIAREGLGRPNSG
jgi:hypothetical protein